MLCLLVVKCPLCWQHRTQQGSRNLILELRLLNCQRAALSGCSLLHLHDLDLVCPGLCSGHTSAVVRSCYSGYVFWVLLRGHRAVRCQSSSLQGGFFWTTVQSRQFPLKTSSDLKVREARYQKQDLVTSWLGTRICMWSGVDCGTWADDRQYPSILYSDSVPEAFEEAPSLLLLPPKKGSFLSF